VSHANDDNRKFAPPGVFGFLHAGPFGPGAKPVAAGEQHPSMDLSENIQHEWSDWFTKASPVSTERLSPSPGGPGRPLPAGREQALAEAALNDLVPGGMLTASQAAPPTEDAAATSVLEPTVVQPAVMKPADSAPVEAEPVEGGPIEAAPIQANPVDAAPVQASPVETSPVETAPVRADLVEASSPTEPIPVEAPPEDGARPG
jgi:hypothetical protein